MEKEQQQLAALVRGKKVAFIGAGVSHRALIEEFVGLGAQVTLCDKKPSVEAFGDYAATIRRLGLRLSLGEGYMDGFRGQDIILRTAGNEYNPAVEEYNNTLSSFPANVIGTLWGIGEVEAFQ